MYRMGLSKREKAAEKRAERRAAAKAKEEAVGQHFGHDNHGHDHHGDHLGHDDDDDHDHHGDHFGHDDDDDNDHDGGVQRIYLQVNPPLVYHPGFDHHVGGDGLGVEDYDCDGCDVDDDDDLGVTLVYKNTKRNMDFKKTWNIYLNFLNDFLKDFYLISIRITFSKPYFT